MTVLGAATLVLVPHVTPNSMVILPLISHYFILLAFIVFFLDPAKPH